MTKAELKRLARHMASDYLRGVLNEGAMENYFELRDIAISEEEITKLEEAMQEIIDRLGK